MIKVVSLDGKGDYTSIQAAIDAADEKERAPQIIVIRNGEYRERVVVNRRNLRIVGEDVNRTVITHSACAKDLGADGKEKGTFLSFTLLVAADNVTLENLTVRNDAGDGREVGQAVAVYAAGDRAVFRNCHLIAHQDTLFCGPLMPKVLNEIAPRTAEVQVVESVGDCPLTHARQYFENCHITGDIDFIFGPYRCWFEKCLLRMNPRGGYYTAANTPEGQAYGFVFHDCLLAGDCAEGAASLGRPWRKYARTLFLNCAMEKCVSPQGFSDWGEDKPINPHLGEYASTDAATDLPLDLSTRDPRQAILTDGQASAVTLRAVLGGYDDWRPDLPKPTWFICGDSIAATYAPDRAPMTGWGQVLGNLTDEAFIENCAMCGRSSKSFVAEGRLSIIELCLRRGDKLLISFSHNDKKPDRPRHTEPWSTFREYLNMYIDAARRNGAEPLMITPMPRRRFDENGQLVPTHLEYPDAMRALAAYRNVKCVDLESAMKALLIDAGKDASARYYCHVPKGHENYPDGCEDNTHLCFEGAVTLARIILDGLCRA